MKFFSGRTNLAIPMGVIAVVAWGFGPLMVRGVHATAGTIVFWRLWMAAPVMLVFARATGGRVTWPLLKAVFLPGAMFGLSIILSFTSYQWTSIANATLIGALQPVLMLLIGPLVFGDRTVGRQILFAVIALGGIATVVLGAHNSSGASLRGDLIALANLAVWTAYFVRIKQVRDRGIHSGALIAGVFCTAAVVITPYVLLTSHDIGTVHGTEWVLIAGMVLVPGLIGHGFMTWAQRHMDITLASLLTLGNPVISAIGAWVVFGQHLGAVQIAGALVVLAAIAGIVVEARSEAHLDAIPVAVAAE